MIYKNVLAHNTIKRFTSVTSFSPYSKHFNRRTITMSAPAPDPPLPPSGNPEKTPDVAASSSSDTPVEGATTDGDAKMEDVQKEPEDTYEDIPEGVMEVSVKFHG